MCVCISIVTGLTCFLKKFHLITHTHTQIMAHTAARGDGGGHAGNLCVGSKDTVNQWVCEYVSE